MNNSDERADVPVLTQVVDDHPDSRAPAVDAAALEVLARELERAMLERLGPVFVRVVGQALEGVRAQLTISVTQMVREAVAASVALALAVPKRD
jgi:hypothetical protein